jgi:hypothetical protein
LRAAFGASSFLEKALLAAGNGGIFEAVAWKRILPKSQFCRAKDPHMEIERRAKSTLTPVMLDPGDRLRFTKSDGSTTVIELVSTRAYVLKREYPPSVRAKMTLKPNAEGNISVYGFAAVFLVDGEELEITREVGSQASFYEPVHAGGISLWLDAVRDIFDTSYHHKISAGGFMIEKDFLNGLGGVCMPRKAARLVVQECGRSICPTPIGPWFGDVPAVPDISQCYNGEDCWMGPYAGVVAHCGLDINMPAGTVLRSPIDLDTQYYRKRVDAGLGNNSWAGFRTWEGGVVWRLSTSHIVEPLVEEHTPLKQGTAYATGAGTAVGLHEHTHFGFHVTEQGGSYFLDPWILFWQMLRDSASGELKHGPATEHGVARDG